MERFSYKLHELRDEDPDLLRLLMIEQMGGPREDQEGGEEWPQE